MKTITLTMLQALRLTLILDNFQGSRKDLHSIQDIKERIGVSDDVMRSVTRPQGNGLIISDEVRTMPTTEFQLVREEARKLVEILDQQSLIIRDLEWVEPLVKELNAIVENKNGLG